MDGAEETRKNAGRIVVADDADALLTSLCQTLSDDGYVVYPATDGDAALQLVLREAPDLLLTDIQMPALNGLDLCRRLKADPATRLIPVILLTGLDSRNDRIAGITAGADDFLTKPVSTAELRARVALVEVRLAGGRR